GGKASRSHQVLQFVASHRVMPRAKARLLPQTIPISYGQQDTRPQHTASKRRCGRHRLPRLSPFLDLAQAHGLSCWSLDPRWRMYGHAATGTGVGMNNQPTNQRPAPARLQTPADLLDRHDRDGSGHLDEDELI